MPTPTQPHGRASLLGIPVELRLTIYDYVLLSPSSSPHAADKGPWKFKYNNSFGTINDYGRYIKRSDPRIPPLAWLSLQSSCSTLRDELHQLTQSLGPLSDGSPYTTYEMRITGRMIRLADLIWTRLPCAPTTCRALDAHVTLPCAVRFRGDGGPTSIAGNLYQTLNRFVHYGPVLDAKTPLPRRARLDVLRVFVHVEFPADGDLERAGVFPGQESPAGGVANFARSLEESGLLQGVVGRIEVLAAASEPDVVRAFSQRIFAQPGDDLEPAASSPATAIAEENGEAIGMVLHANIVVQPRDEGREIPEHWKGYGFGWGVGPSGAE